MDGHRGHRRRGTVRAVVAALALLLTAVLAGCSGGAGTMSSDAGSADRESLDGLTSGSSGGGRDGVLRDGGDLDSGGAPGTGANRAPVQTRAVISIGQVDLEADDLGVVRDEIDRLLGRFGGFIAREETHNDEEGRTARSTLQLRVPSQHFETVMGSFSEFSTVVDAGRRAEDVTTEVIDVESRIRTQEISLQRLRKFLGQSGRVTDVIRLESEIARREADLASLRAQQEYLADQTTLATITVRMALPPEKAAEDDDPLEDAGFLTGLRNGREALTDVAIVGATALGAMLPFLAVLALVGVPLLVWVRLGRRRRTVAGPPVTDPLPPS